MAEKTKKFKDECPTQKGSEDKDDTQINWKNVLLQKEIN